MTLVLKIRDKFKCCGELLIHFLLCLLITNILLSASSHLPPSLLLSNVRPSHISPGSFEGQPVSRSLLSRRRGVDVANVVARSELVLCPPGCPPPHMLLSLRTWPGEGGTGGTGGQGGGEDRLLTPWLVNIDSPLIFSLGLARQSAL